MAIAYRTSTGADAGSVSTNTTLTITPTAGDTVYVVARLGNNTTAPTLAFTAGSGGTWTKDLEFDDSTNSDRLYLYSSTNSGGGSTTVKLTPNTTTTVRWALLAYDFGSGNDGILDKSASSFQTVAVSGTADSTATATTTQANELVLGFAKTEQTHTTGAGLAAGTGYNLREARNKVFVEDKVVSATGTYNSTIANDTIADSGNANAWLQAVATYYAQARAGTFVGDDDDNAMTFTTTVLW